MNRKNSLCWVVSWLCFGSLALAQSSHWLHVRVENAGAEAEKVKVNVPLSMVETVWPMIEENDLTQGKITLGKTPLTVPQMREIWQSLKREGDFELASIQDGATDVRIFKEGDCLYIRSTEEAKEEISITIPAPVVDALLSGDGDQLDVMGALKALTQSGVGEIVKIRDGEETVRVWIDNSGSSE